MAVALAIVLGDHIRSVAKANATAASPPPARRRSPGRPVRMSRQDGQAAPGAGRAGGDRTRADRADDVARPGPTTAAPARRGWRWRWSCRGTPVPWWRTDRPRLVARRRRPQGDAGRLDAHRRRVLVVGRDAPGAAATATTERGRDGRTLQTPVGHVGPVARRSQSYRCSVRCCTAAVEVGDDAGETRIHKIETAG